MRNVSGDSSAAEHRFRSQRSGWRRIASDAVARLVTGFVTDQSGHGRGRNASRKADGSRAHNTPAAGGSNPLRLTKFPTLTWAQDLGLPACPYLRRWVLDFGAFSVRLHRWQASDDTRAFHDHAWWFVSLMLKGRAVDVSAAGHDVLRPGSLRFRRAEHAHTFAVITPGTWTVLVTGTPVRRWGFWVNGRLWKRDRYFAMMGHHPCDGGNAVRFAPDGTVLW